MKNHALPCCTLALALFAMPLAATETPATGRSAHGEAFDSGPRQAAVLMGGTGVVAFPVTTKSTEAQAFVTQGVGLLHGFWYFEAERSFRQAATLDPYCAMAYWGMAFANFDNEKRAKAFIAEALKRQEKASPRERLYIEALAGYFNGPKRDAGARRALAAKYEAIAFKFPTDLEAKAFLLWQLWDNNQHGVPLESKLAVNALIGEILAVEPRHPVHHYRVHITNPNDDPVRAFASAALCGPVASSVPHMWHMPGHTYVDAKRYADAAWQMEASLRLENAHMIRTQMVPDENHLYVHNRGWLIDNLEFAGRVRAAIDLCKHVIELPRQPKGGSSAADARRKLLDMLVRHERWDELKSLADSEYFDPTDDRSARARRLVLLGRAELGRDDRSAAIDRLAALNELAADAQRDVAAAWGQAYGPNHLAEMIAAAWASGTAPSPADFAVDLLATERLLRGPAPKSPPDIKGKIAILHGIEQAVAELRGHIALANGASKAAREWFAKAGDVGGEVMASVAVAAADGDANKADQLSRDTGRRVYKLANRVDLLQRTGKTEAARAAFADLRVLAGTADLDDPPLARLAPLAASFGWPADWRTPVTPADVGSRPPLDSFGPFRWTGWHAPDWSLRDHEGRVVRRSDYLGKPIVVIFYEGMGCVHCVEQLADFSPKAKDFTDAGIEIVAIGTDTVQALDESAARGTLPFTVLSDPAMTVFRAFHAFDDFERLPLHGTILIDGNGQVRWQNIGAEPFEDPDFLLAEAKRLLKYSR